MNSQDRTESCRDTCPATPLFRIESSVYTWPQVLAFAEFNRSLEPIWRRTRAGLVAATYAETHDFPLTPEELQTATIELRYRHHLITADETLGWLATRDLSLDVMEDYLWRHLMHEQVREELEESGQLSGDTDLPAIDVARHLWDETILGGTFDSLTMDLARHATVRHLQLISGKQAADARRRAEQGFRDRFRLTTGDMLSDAVAGCHFLVAADLPGFLELSAYYLAYTDVVATPEVCERQIRLMRSNYVEIEYEIASFASRDAANEAYLCVTLDDEDLETVAGRALCAYAVHQENLASLNGDLGKRLLSAPLNTFVEPFELESDDRFHLIRVIHKHEPDLKNPRVLQRLRHRLVVEALAPNLEHRVEWQRWKPEFTE